MKVKALLYCTKAKPYLSSNSFEYYVVDKKTYKSYMGNYNGKIVAECEMEVEEINVIHHYETSNVGIFCYDEVGTKTLDQFNLLQKSCLTRFELSDYLGTKDGYALHIKNLMVLNRPFELSELLKYEQSCYKDSHLTKAPQNMCSVWYKGQMYILISIQPHWLCKILNGDKILEIRKKVLKCMKGN